MQWKAIAIAIFIAPASLAQEGDGERAAVWEWLERAWREAPTSLDAFAGHVVRYRTEWHNGRLSRTEIDRLKREVEGKPDHPARRRIEVAERRLRSGPDTTDCEIWVGPDGQWRKAETPHYNEALSRTDRVVTPGHMWTMTSQHLSIFHPRRGEIPPGQDPRLTESNTLYELSGMMHGHVGYGWRVGETLASLRRDGGDWIASSESDNGTSIVYRLRWDERLDRCFVESRTIVDAHEDFHDQIGQEHRYDDWAYDENVEKWIASVTGRYDGAGVLEHRVVWEGMEPLADGKFRELAKIPEIDGADSETGPVTVSKVYDYRPSGLSVTARTADGELAETPMPGAEPRSLLRILGVVSIVGLLVLFAIVRARRVQGETT